MAKKAAIQPKPKQHAKKGGAKKGAGKGQVGGGAKGQAGSWAFIPNAFAAAFGGNLKKFSKGNGKSHGKGNVVQTKFNKGGNGKAKQPAKAPATTSKYMETLAKIDASRKVWVGGLNKATTWKQLEAHFKDVAKPSVTEIMKNGKACLAFKTDDDAQSAISSLNGTELGGNTIEVDVWTQKERPEKVEGEVKSKKKKNKNKKANTVIKTAFASKSAKKSAKKVRGDPKTKEKLAAIDNSLKVWVGGLKATTNAAYLRKHFADAGCKPHLFNLTGKDAACLSFRTTEEVDSAISTLNGTTLEDNVLEVDAWTKPERKEKTA